MIIIIFMFVPWSSSWAKSFLLSPDDAPDYRHTPKFPCDAVSGEVLTFEVSLGADRPKEDGPGVQASSQQLEAQRRTLQG